MVTTQTLMERARQAQPYVRLAGRYLGRATEALGLAILWIVKAWAEGLSRNVPERDLDWLERLQFELDEERDRKKAFAGRIWMGEEDPPPWSDFYDRRP
jgi:hypothetical protein